MAAMRGCELSACPSGVLTTWSFFSVERYLYSLFPLSSLFSYFVPVKYHLLNLPVWHQACSIKVESVLTFLQCYYLLQVMLLTGFPYDRSSFSSTATGYRILVTILDRLEKYLDAPETAEEGKVFELGYELCPSQLFHGDA